MTHSQKHPTRRKAFALVVAVAGMAMVGCSAAESDNDPGAPSDSSEAGARTAALSGEITVLAAASLSGAFSTLGRQFEVAQPQVTVTFSFAGSSALAAQITAGAPADVFAAASATNMEQVVEAGAARNPQFFASNALAIAVPPTNPGKVVDLESLANPDVKTALCQVQVPCGASAAKVFDNANLTVAPVTLEPDVKSVLSKVLLGEVDAGLVYVTDVLAAGDKVTGIEIPAEVNVSTTYPIAALSESTNPDIAAAFIDFVLSVDGATVLTEAGFQRP